jgi:hypothetical protein
MNTDSDMKSSLELCPNPDLPQVPTQGCFGSWKPHSGAPEGGMYTGAPGEEEGLCTCLVGPVITIRTITPTPPLGMFLAELFLRRN